jgi:hypothetical protein
MPLDRTRPQKSAAKGSKFISKWAGNKISLEVQPLFRPGSWLDSRVVANDRPEKD